MTYKQKLYMKYLNNSTNVIDLNVSCTDESEFKKRWTIPYYPYIYKL